MKKAKLVILILLLGCGTLFIGTIKANAAAPKFKVIVKYVNKDTGKIISSDYTTKINKGKIYSAKKKTITGYKSPATIKKTIKKNITITYKYSPRTYTVTEVYRDKETNTKIASDHKSTAKYDTVYSAYQRTITGYDKPRVDKHIVKGNKTITYKYIPKTYTVTTKYVDSETQATISTNTSSSVKYNRSYTSPRKEINGYTKPNAQTNIINGTKTIIYKYLPKTFKVTTEFVDKDTNARLAVDVTAYVKYNRKYESPIKIIIGYIGPSSQTNTIKESKTITYKYEAKNYYITTLHRDIDTDEILGEDTIEGVKYGTKYVSKIKTISGYKTYSTEGITVTRNETLTTYYKRETPSDLWDNYYFTNRVYTLSMSLYYDEELTKYYRDTDVSELVQMEKAAEKDYMRIKTSDGNYYTNRSNGHLVYFYVPLTGFVEWQQRNCYVSLSSPDSFTLPIVPFQKAFWQEFNPETGTAKHYSYENGLWILKDDRYPGLRYSTNPY
ncbi:MucBP domain-containing protein [Neobacillus drentensis]|uniref:MucBP domain-containing protein n=1 Tax=Neobacillus drentensis TaxID=220684 RepID=UPI002FFF1A13